MEIKEIKGNKNELKVELFGYVDTFPMEENNTSNKNIYAVAVLYGIENHAPEIIQVFANSKEEALYKGKTIANKYYIGYNKLDAVCTHLCDPA